MLRTLGECMLACSGNINRLGSVNEGTTMSDYHKNEQERKFSIQISLLHAEWMESRSMHQHVGEGRSEFAVAEGEEDGGRDHCEG